MIEIWRAVCLCISAFGVGIVVDHLCKEYMDKKRFEQWVKSQKVEFMEISKEDFDKIKEQKEKDKNEKY